MEKIFSIGDCVLDDTHHKEYIKTNHCGLLLSTTNDRNLGVDVKKFTYWL